MRVLVALLAIAAAAHAFSPAPPRTTTTSTTALDANRRQALGGLVAAAAAAVTLATPLPAFAAPEVLIEVKNEGKGPKPQKGELAAIRFKAMAGNNVIDDIYDTPEPYYTRIGSGGMLKGVEQTLLDMRVGDRWVLTIPGNLAFGPKGRPASAGKPRIPSDATIVFDVEMVGLPGREPELIELIGD